MKKLNNKNGFTLIELIMVMIILGVLAAVAIPRYLDTIENAEEASEDAVVSNIEAALENYAVHKLLDSGRRIWPDNPFETLATISFDYDKDQTDMTQMTGGDWIFTGESGLTYEDISLANAIVHRRVEDTLSVWIYNADDGSISHGDTPYLPYTKIFKGDLGAD